MTIRTPRTSPALAVSAHRQGTPPGPARPWSLLNWAHPQAHVLAWPCPVPIPRDVLIPGAPGWDGEMGQAARPMSALTMAPRELPATQQPDSGNKNK